MKAQTRKYIFLGSGLVVALIFAWVMWNRANSRKVLSNILAAVDGKEDDDPIAGDNPNPTYGDSRDLSISAVMSPSFWTKNKSRVTIWANNADGSEGPARKLAKQIYNANSAIPFADKETAVIAAFKALQTKEDVSKLADVFSGMYKQDLYTFLNRTWLTGDCEPEEDKCKFGLSTNYLKQIYDQINRLA